MTIRRRDITGIVFAGGASRRFGSDKRSLVLGGQTLLERSLLAVGRIAPRVIVLGAPPAEPYRILAGPREVSWRSDRRPGEGPLWALADALDDVRTPWLLLTAVDYPFAAQILSIVLASARYEFREGIQEWIPQSGDRTHYLCGLYATGIWRDARQAVTEGERSVYRYLEPYLESGRVRTVPLSGVSEFAVNINTPGDWEEVFRSRILMEAAGGEQEGRTL